MIHSQLIFWKENSRNCGLDFVSRNLPEKPAVVHRGFLCLNHFPFFTNVRAHLNRFFARLGVLFGDDFAILRHFFSFKVIHKSFIYTLVTFLAFPVHILFKVKSLEDAC